MRLVNKIILSSLLATTILPAIEIDSLGVNLGVSNISAKQSNKVGVINLNSSPKESYTHGELYMLIDGLTDDETIKASINYINSTNSDFKNNILMVGINKYYQIDKYNIYTGVLLGAGHLEWKTDPIPTTKTTDLTAGSVVGALQVGAEYQVQNNIALGLNTKYYLSNYTTKLNVGTNKAEITHKSSYSLSVGVRYFF